MLTAKIFNDMVETAQRDHGRPDLIATLSLLNGVTVSGFLADVSDVLVTLAEARGIPGADEVHVPLSAIAAFSFTTR